MNPKYNSEEKINQFLMNRNRIQVYLSLGGNEGFVLDRLKQAIAVLSHQNEVANLQVSHFYHTAPLQMESSSAWFVNVVCSFQTFLTLQQVFQLTESIEIQFGKVKKPKNAARLIDIDLVFYGDQMCRDDDLEIPHPCWKDRLFVLIPLADLTKIISLCGLSGMEHYVLEDLIRLLLSQSSQKISLLEKNPRLQ